MSAPYPGNTQRWRGLQAIPAGWGRCVATIGVFDLPHTKHLAMAVAPWDNVWEQTEPAVYGDAVYVTPNAGVAVKVDRFDGKVRWARTYAAHEAPPVT